jgi:FkbM family methyltransferase
MKKLLTKLKRKMSRRLPESTKEFLRKLFKVVTSPRKNSAIPVEELKTFDLLKDCFRTVFDIGAREDLSFYYMKKDCEYHLFEPNTKAVTILKNKINSLPESNITLNEFGLSNENADNCVYYEDSQSFAINPFHKDVDTGQRYSLRTLDGYVTQHNISHIDFLKIDAEGFDYKIIQGGITTITSKVDYIQFEYWDDIKKYTDLLGNTFTLYLMMESRLLEAIFEDAIQEMTPQQKERDYKKSLIILDDNTIDLIERVLEPKGYGGNIFGIVKDKRAIDVQKLIFDIA